MEESKRKELEARLQELFARSELESPESSQIEIKSRTVVKVIRRRKGQPDLQLT